MQDGLRLSALMNEQLPRRPPPAKLPISARVTRQLGALRPQRSASMTVDYCSKSLMKARDRFHRAAESGGAVLDELPVDARRPRGEPLSISIARLGSDAPDRVLLHSSAVTGIARLSLPSKACGSRSPLQDIVLLSSSCSCSAQRCSCS